MGEIEVGQFQSPSGFGRVVAGIHPVVLHRQLSPQKLRKLRCLILRGNQAPVARGDIEQDRGVARAYAMFVVRACGIEVPDVRAPWPVVPFEVTEVLRIRPDVPDIEARTPAGMRHDQIRRIALLLHFPPDSRQPLPVENCRLHKGQVGVLLLVDLPGGVGNAPCVASPVASLASACRRSLHDLDPTCNGQCFRTGRGSCCGGRAGAFNRFRTARMRLQSLCDSGLFVSRGLLPCIVSRLRTLQQFMDLRSPEEEYRRRPGRRGRYRDADIGIAVTTPPTRPFGVM